MRSLNLDLLLLAHVPLEETSRTCNLSGGKNTDDGQNLRAKNYEMCFSV